MFQKIFPEHFRKTEEELKEIWGEARFILDTNVLLNFYRYSATTRDDLLDVLETISTRIWIPHRVAEEFSRRRIGVIIKQNDIVKNYKQALSEIGESARKTLTKALERKHHTIISNEEFLSQFDALIEKAHEQLDLPNPAHIDDDRKDHVLERLNKIVQGRIGSPFDEKERQTAIQQGEERFKNKIPPGYCDEKKDGEEKLGDWFIWKQILGFAGEQKKAIILITDDEKEDWWQRVSGRKIGPRSELVAEMKNVAGVAFHLYSSEKFLEHAKSNLGSDIEDKTLIEVRHLAAKRRRVKNKKAQYSRKKRLSQINSELDKLQKTEASILNQLQPEEINRINELIAQLEREQVKIEHQMRKAKSGFEKEHLDEQHFYIDQQIHEQRMKIQEASLNRMQASPDMEFLWEIQQRADKLRNEQKRLQAELGSTKASSGQRFFVDWNAERE